jgi:hypothetical protein
MNSYWKGKKFLKEIANSERQLQEKIQQIVSYEYVDKHPIAILLQKAQLEHPRSCKDYMMNILFRSEWWKI